MEQESQMTPQPKLQQLAAWIEGLDPEERLELLRRALTPEMRFCLLVEELSQGTKDLDREEVGRDIDEAVRQVRRARGRTAA